jgi:hypothetical protein
VSRKRDGAKRHQTLHAAVDWSYQLLAPELQRFFARLSVFRGGWTLEAAEAVCEEPLALDDLAQLRECSLILTEEEGDQTRFRMLETLREFAQECLEASGEAPILYRQHADFFVSLAERAEPPFRGLEEAAWIDRLERENINLRTALDWIQREQSIAPERGLTLAWSLYQFWFARLHLKEGRERLGAFLSLPGASEPTPDRARVLLAAANLASMQADYAAERSFCDERVELWRKLEDKTNLAWALCDLAMRLGHMGDLGTRVGPMNASLTEEGLSIFRELNDKQGIAYALNALASGAHVQANYTLAHTLYEEGLAIARGIADQERDPGMLNTLANTAVNWGNDNLARSLFEEVLAVARAIEQKRYIAHSLHELGNLSARQGDPAAAQRLLRESLAIWSELRDKYYGSFSLEGLAFLAVTQGQSERAARLFGALEAHRETVSVPPVAAERAEYHRSVADARSALGEEAFAAAWAAGRALTLEQAIRVALEESEIPT